MTWEPRLNIQPVTRFRENLIYFMQQHIDDCLIWAADQCGLSTVPPSPEGFFNSMAVRPKRPIVNVLAGGADPEDDEDGNRLEVKRLVIEIERTAGDSDQLITVLEPYTLAFTSMVLEMTDDDWFRNIGNDDRGDLDVTVGRERYSGRTYETEKTFLQVGSVEVTLIYTQT